MITAKIGDPRKSSEDNPSLQTVTLEFDVLTEFSLDVLHRMLEHLNNELTRPILGNPF